MKQILHSIRMYVCKVHLGHCIVVHWNSDKIIAGPSRNLAAPFLSWNDSAYLLWSWIWISNFLMETTAYGVPSCLKLFTCHSFNVMALCESSSFPLIIVDAKEHSVANRFYFTLFVCLWTGIITIKPHKQLFCLLFVSKLLKCDKVVLSCSYVINLKHFIRLQKHAIPCLWEANLQTRMAPHFLSL